MWLKCDGWEAMNMSDEYIKAMTRGKSEKELSDYEVIELWKIQNKDRDDRPKEAADSAMITFIITMGIWLCIIAHDYNPIGGIIGIGIAAFFSFLTHRGQTRAMEKWLRRERYRLWLESEEVRNKHKKEEEEMSLCETCGEEIVVSLCEMCRECDMCGEEIVVSLCEMCEEEDISLCEMCKEEDI